MPHDTLVILQTLPTYTPLYWVEWTRRWDGLGSAEARCRLLTPEDEGQQQRLRDLYSGGTPVFCMLKDPVAHKWYFFEAYLATYRVYGSGAHEVTLRPSGAIREADADAYGPLTLRKKRTDARLPRKPRPTPIEMVGKV